MRNHANQHVQVLTGSFVLRLYTLPKYGFVPESLLKGLAEKAPNFDKWAKEVAKHPR
jgi:glutathione S-transferase